MSNRFRQRFGLGLLGFLLTLGAYFAAYFSCVSIAFRASHEKNVLSAIPPIYRCGLLTEKWVRYIFVPAFLIDSTYIRPHAWEDKKAL
jgi:hypothetical protein